MAKFKSEDLLNDLAQDVRKVKESAEFFKPNGQDETGLLSRGGEVECSTNTGTPERL